jgi:hypothetical protein
VQRAAKRDQRGRGKGAEQTARCTAPGLVAPRSASASRGTSWREQDVPNSCQQYDILVYQLKVVHMFVKFPTVIFHGKWRFQAVR